MKCCINGGKFIRLLFLSAKLLKFEIQKCGQILCAHKPYFLMPGHIYSLGFSVHMIKFVLMHHVKNRRNQTVNLVKLFLCVYR